MRNLQNGLDTDMTIFVFEGVAIQVFFCNTHF